MEFVRRKVTYRLYPSVKQANRLAEISYLHQRLYNAALEERVDAYKKCKVSISFADQCKSLTQVRAENPEYFALNAQSGQVTLKRLDLAFKNFFRRVQEGAKQPGFPRFKSRDRFKGWGYKAHGDGWKFKAGAGFVNGTLNLSGVGSLPSRGRARFQDKERKSRDAGIPKTLEIIKKGGQWYASVTFISSALYRKSGEECIGMDWGTSKFLTIVNENAETVEIANPRHWNACKDKLKKQQRILSRKKKGSRNREKIKLILSKTHRSLGWQRENFLHQTSAKVIINSKLIGVEDLNVKAMTARGGRYKAGLNRSILDTSPGKFFRLLQCKAEEAGIGYVNAPTKTLKPSQTCARCHHKKKKLLSERQHHCLRCSFKCDRDVNAALVILQYALKTVSGQELTLGVEGFLEYSEALLKHETPSIPQACTSS